MGVGAEKLLVKYDIGFQRGGYTGEHVGSPKRPVTSRYTEQ